jgi:hypothetical protein
LSQSASSGLHEVINEDLTAGEIVLQFRNRLTILFGFRDLFFKTGDLTGIDINRD